MPLESGHEAAPLEGEELERQEKDYVGFNHGIARFTPGNWFLPTAFTQFANKIYNFEWQPNDVLVMGYPRSGTVWLQEVIWTMRCNPDLDNPMAVLPILGRTPYVDMDMLMDGKKMPAITPENPMVKAFMQLCPGGNPADGVCVQIAAATPGLRTIKCHLPLSLLHPKTLTKAKAVYVARNCRDVLVSIHHHCRLLPTFGYKGSLEEFLPYFMDDEVVYGPYWLHIKEAWEKKGDPNLHFVFYEDFQKDVKAEVKKLNEFLGTGLTEEQMDKVIKHTSFEEMKKRDNVIGPKSSENPMMDPKVVEEHGGFFRKGEVGDWKSKLSAETVEKLDKWIQEKLSDVPFKYTV
ncbi:sulfotransferase 1E1-like isoform X2 [Macrobrachium nipponense]